MQVLIHVNLAAPRQIPFELALIRWTKQTLTGVTTFDFDNHSEAILAGYAIDLINQSEKVLLYILNQQGPEAALGGLMKVMQNITRKQGKQINVVLQGAHPMIERMSRALPAGHFTQVDTMEKGKEKVSSFFLSE